MFPSLFRSGPAVAPMRRLGMVTAVVGLLSACTGNIGSGGNPGGDRPGVGQSGENGSMGGRPNGGGSSNGGEVVVPPPPPENAPVTGPFASAPAPSSRLVRLSHQQWENTVTDLFGMDEPSGLSREFLSEPIRSTFDNNGSILQVTTDLWQDYQKAAEALGRAAREPARRMRFLPGGGQDAEAFIRSFVKQAYRRPLTDDEVRAHRALFDQGAQLVGSGDAFADGVEVLVTAVLQSPHFLYRVELSNAVENGLVRLSGYEVASRLSYGLTNSMPDGPLFAAAEANQLAQRDQVMAQATRLLESERGKETLRDFHTQVWHLGAYTEVKRDEERFPAFDAAMGPDMQAEAHAFIEEVIFGNEKGVTELLTAPYSYVNPRLAPLYGVEVPGEDNSRFVRVDLDPQRRAGLYTQIGFLAVNATDAAPRSIMRGVHINLDALCIDLPAPPNVPPDPPEDVGKTNRQLLEAFTEADGTVCVGCHGALINPPGFAFENFDGLGQWRDMDNGQPIDATGTFDFGEGPKPFQGPVELMKVVAQSPMSHACYAQHLLEYLFGRERVKEGPLKAADDGVIAELGRRSQKDVSIKSMILDLVATDAFVTRLP